VLDEYERWNRTSHIDRPDEFLLLEQCPDERTLKVISVFLQINISVYCVIFTEVSDIETHCCLRLADATQ
jgi:hypothetical protein